ncbi:Serine/threonine-protein phosphatase pp1 [Ascosphaera pollenicola]|nr:Serine/threonine-protein phosphatase pp1 [Ascosphaera pollenicola]
MAVMCNGKLVFGVWGDENGADAGCSLTGEASVSLGRLCYGDSINGNAGPNDDEILYLAFPGSVEDTVPKDVANWNADNYHDFEQSITDFGNNLLKKTFKQ